LLRRGFAPAVAGLVAGLSREAAGSAAPLVAETVKAATLFAAGKAATAPAVLAEGVLRSMFLTKLKTGALLLVTLGALGTGTAGLALRTGPASVPATEVRTEAQAAAMPPVFQGNGEAAVRADDKDKQIQELRDQLRQAELEVRRARELAEVAVRRSEVARDEAQRYRAEAERLKKEIDCVLKTVDVEKNTVSVTLRGTNLSLEAIPIAPTARFVLKGKECSIDDLKPGALAAIEVKTEGEKSVVIRIRAE
jgi:hypothetical protein